MIDSILEIIPITIANARQSFRIYVLRQSCDLSSSYDFLIRCESLAKEPATTDRLARSRGLLVCLFKHRDSYIGTVCSLAQ